MIKTQGDIIRSMSNEDLVDYLFKILSCGKCPTRDECRGVQFCKESLTKYVNRKFEVRTVSANLTGSCILTESQTPIKVSKSNKKDKDSPIPPVTHERSGMGWTYNDYYCPNCDTFLVPEPAALSGPRPKRCPECGQLIDWSNISKE